MKVKVLTIISLVLLASCASTRPKKEKEVGYVIYNVIPTSTIRHKQIAEAVEKALQENTSSLKVNHEIPPFPLPEKPGRFQLSNPFKGTGFAALAASSGQSMKIPSCENAIVTINAFDSSMSKYGENIRFFTCVLPYKGGYHVDVYTEFSATSGGFSSAALGAMLAKSVIGNSSQFIPRTLESIVAELKATGSEVSLVEAYP